MSAAWRQGNGIVRRITVSSEIQRQLVHTLLLYPQTNIHRTRCSLRIVAETTSRESRDSSKRIFQLPLAALKKFPYCISAGKTRRWIVYVPAASSSASLIWRLAQKWLEQSGWPVENGEGGWKNRWRNIDEKKSLEDQEKRWRKEILQGVSEIDGPTLVLMVLKYIPLSHEDEKSSCKYRKIVFDDLTGACRKYLEILAVL